MKKTKYIEIVLAMLIFMAVAYVIIRPRIRREYAFFWTSAYFYIVYFALLFAFLYILLKKTKIIERTKKFLKYPAYFIFLPFALLPIIRCYFKIPYIFCKACPRKCPFGEMRPFIIPLFLVQNLDCRFWCYRLCPLGTIQDYNSKACRKKISLPKWVLYFRYVFLAFTVLVVLGVIAEMTFLTRGFYYRNTYHFVIPTLIIAGVIFILSFFIPRFWCNYFCPIGSFSDLVLKAENRIKKKSECKTEN